MVDWKTKIKVGDLHAAHRKGDMPITAVAKALAARIERNEFKNELAGLVARLRRVRNVRSYDSCLRTLYDFGDQDHRIWVDAF